MCGLQEDPDNGLPSITGQNYKNDYIIPVKGPDQLYLNTNHPNPDKALDISELFTENVSSSNISQFVLFSITLN